MSKIIIMGSGAAPGVPCLSRGFGACNPDNEKNYRMRSGTYMELSGVKFLIDTSPDLRMQLLYSDITELDAVFYTHVHADHLHGIDDLREVNRVMQKPIELYASEFVGFLFSTYIIMQSDHDAFLVDQHAAHERVLYERFGKKREAMDETQRSVQELLIPQIIDLSTADMSFVTDNIDRFLEG
jgi:phosphoribosyl 1,2-cyclic phosphodiesterase